MTPDMSRAACIGYDPELWFSTDSGDQYEAAAICRGCPVQFECLNQAIETRDIWAIRGGLTPAQRRPLLPPSTCATPDCDRPVMAHNGARYCSAEHSRIGHRGKQREYGRRRPLQVKGSPRSAA